MDWSPYYPAHFSTDGSKANGKKKCVEFADIGCGYGGLLGKLILYSVNNFALIVLFISIMAVNL